MIDYDLQEEMLAELDNAIDPEVDIFSQNAHDRKVGRPIIGDPIASFIQRTKQQIEYAEIMKAGGQLPPLTWTWFKPILRSGWQLQLGKGALEISGVSCWWLNSLDEVIKYLNAAVTRAETDQLFQEVIKLKSREIGDRLRKSVTKFTNRAA